MSEAATIKDYDIRVYWDSRAEYFVAEIQEIYTCAADGATQAEAVSNLEETFAVLKEAYAEEKLSLPRPDPELPISIGELSALSDVVKVSRLAELSGIPVQTLATKLKRGTEFSAAESRGIARALDERGLALRARYPPGNRAGGLQFAEEPSSKYQPAGRPASESVIIADRGRREPRLGSRHRDLTGQIERKHGNTLLAALRKQYGQHLAPGRRSDVTLRTLRVESGGKSLSQILKGAGKQAKAKKHG